MDNTNDNIFGTQTYDNTRMADASNPAFKSYLKSMLHKYGLAASKADARSGHYGIYGMDLFKNILKQARWGFSRSEKYGDSVFFGNPYYNPDDSSDDDNDTLLSYVSDNKRFPTDREDYTKYTTRRKYKKEYDTSILEDLQNYENGLPPLKYQTVDKAAQQLEDFRTKADALRSSPGATYNDILRLWDTYATLKQLQAAADKAKEDRDTSLTGLDAQDDTSIYGTKVSKKSNLALDLLAKIGYDPYEGFTGLLNSYRAGYGSSIQQQKADMSPMGGTQQTQAAPAAPQIREDPGAMRADMEAARQDQLLQNYAADQQENSGTLQWKGDGGGSFASNHVRSSFAGNDQHKPVPNGRYVITPAEVAGVQRHDGYALTYISDDGSSISTEYYPTLGLAQFIAKRYYDAVTQGKSPETALLNVAGVNFGTQPQVITDYINSLPKEQQRDESERITDFLTAAWTGGLGGAVNRVLQAPQSVLLNIMSLSNPLFGKPIDITPVKTFADFAPAITQEVAKIPWAGENIVNPMLEMATNPLSYVGGFMGAGDIAAARAAMKPGTLAYERALQAGKLAGQSAGVIPQDIGLGSKPMYVDEFGNVRPVPETPLLLTEGKKPPRAAVNSKPRLLTLDEYNSMYPSVRSETVSQPRTASGKAPGLTATVKVRDEVGAPIGEAAESSTIMNMPRARNMAEAAEDRTNMMTLKGETAGGNTTGTKTAAASRPPMTESDWNYLADTNEFSSDLGNGQSYKIVRQNEKWHTMRVDTETGDVAEYLGNYKTVQEAKGAAAADRELIPPAEAGFTGNAYGQQPRQAPMSLERRATQQQEHPLFSMIDESRGAQSATQALAAPEGAPDIAPRVSYDTNPARRTPGELWRGFKSGVRKVYQQTVAGQSALERVSKIQNPTEATMNDLTQAVRNASGQVDYIARHGMTDLAGNTIGPSWKSIVDSVPIRDQAAFNEYMLNRLNVERVKAGKPLFEGRTAAESQAIVDDLARLHPDFKNVANDVYDFIKTSDREHLVSSGLLSEDDVLQLEATYEDYVPGYRKKWQGKTQQTADVKGGERTTVSPGEVIHEAVGGSSDIVPVQDSVMRKVNKNLKAARTNELYRSIYHWAEKNPEDAAGLVDIVKPGEESGIMRSAESLDDALNTYGKEALQDLDNGVYRMTAYENGKPIAAKVSKEVYDNLQALANKSIGSDPELWMKVLGYAMNPMKALITGYNPMFIVRNVLRDLPTYWQYSRGGPIQSIKNLGVALKEMLSNGERWRNYQALGGGEANYYNNFAGFTQSNKTTLLDMIKQGDVAHIPIGAGRAVKNAVGTAGSTAESLPRFAEYLNGIEKYGDNYTGRLKAMADAADVTTNFSRSGPAGRVANTAVPYVNAYIQGLDKFVRAALGRGGRTAAESAGIAAKTWTKILVSTGVPTIVLYELNKGNPHYQDLDNNTTDGNFLFPNFGNLDENGNAKTFIKIPKPREAGWFAAALERGMRAMEGDDKPFAGLGKSFATQFAPQNPLTENIFSPFLFNVPQNKDYAGRDIVPQSMIDLEPKYQYDANTTQLSRKLGEWFNLSPKQVDYILRQYTGVFGQVGMPMMTGQSKTGEDFVSQLFLGPLRQNFTANPAFQSGIISEFYDTIDEATTKAKTRARVEEIPGKYSTPEDRMLSGLTEASKAIAQLRWQEQDVLASDAAQTEKNAQVQALREQANEIARAALTVYKAGTENATVYPFNNAKTEAKYDSMVQHGIEQDDVNRIFTELDALEPEEGHKTVTENQKKNYILNKMTWLTPDERKYAALDLGLLTPEEERKVLEHFKGKSSR